MDTPPAGLLSADPAPQSLLAPVIQRLAAGFVWSPFALCHTTFVDNKY